MHRIAIVAATLCLLFATGAMAEVATTDFLPGQGSFIAPEAAGLNGTSFTPLNPGALPWSSNSSIGVGGFSGTRDESHIVAGMPTAKSLDINGRFAGLRWVGPTFGAALDYTAAKASPFPDDFHSVNPTLQLSAKIGSWLGLGIGAERNHVDETQISGGVFTPMTLDINSKQAGLSLRLGSWLYIGGAKVRDSLENSQAMGFTFERDSNRTGIAVRTEGPWAWYLEYYVVDSKPFTYNGLPLVGSEFREQTVAAQVKVGSFVLGGSSAKIQVPAKASGVAPDLKLSTIDVAWAPMQGFTLGLRALRFREQGQEIVSPAVFLTPYTSSIDANFLSIGWAF